MTSTEIAIIGAPSSAGARRTGQEKAPAAFRAAGLVGRLRDAGLDVADLGDLPTVTYRLDSEHPRGQNVAAAAGVARQVADRVDRALTDGRAPIVLGGDCTLGLGTLAGLLRHRERPGLLYFDGDLDLNTPETTRSGILDGMVMALALGRGDPELAGLGLRVPLLSERDVVLFGYDAESGWIDPPEIEVLERLSVTKYPLARVRKDPGGAARQALGILEKRPDPFLVHFDVDVTNLPAADVPHPRGLDPGAAFDALAVLAASHACAGLVVTELNVDDDRDGSQARCVVDGLVRSLGARAKRRGR